MDVTMMLAATIMLAFSFAKARGGSTVRRGGPGFTDDAA